MTMLLSYQQAIELKIWKDSNSNGIVDGEEIRSLPEHNITSSIYLGRQSVWLMKAVNDNSTSCDRGVFYV